MWWREDYFLTTWLSRSLSGNNSRITTSTKIRRTKHFQRASELRLQRNRLGYNHVRIVADYIQYSLTRHNSVSWPNAISHRYKVRLISNKMTKKGKFTYSLGSNERVSMEISHYSKASLKCHFNNALENLLISWIFHILKTEICLVHTPVTYTLCNVKYWILWRTAHQSTFDKYQAPVVKFHFLI